MTGWDGWGILWRDRMDGIYYGGVGWMGYIMMGWDYVD